jgi:hypothetical protein
MNKLRSYGENCVCRVSLDRQEPLTLWGKAFVLGGGGEVVLFWQGSCLWGSCRDQTKQESFQLGGPPEGSYDVICLLGKESGT